MWEYFFGIRGDCFIGLCTARLDKSTLSHLFLFTHRQLVPQDFSALHPTNRGETDLPAIAPWSDFGAHADMVCHLMIDSVELTH